MFLLGLLGSTLFALTRPATTAADTYARPVGFQSNDQPSLTPAQQITRTTWPAYGPVTILLEDQGGSVAELSFTHPDNFLTSFSILKEGSIYYLWLNNVNNISTGNYDSVEQRFESEDGLVWHNRMNTNLAIKSTYWKFVEGLRAVIKDGPLYEGWEQCHYSVISGWWAHYTRYITSTDGISWTVVNEMPTETAIFPSLVKEGGIYHIWTRPEVDSRYDPDKRIRYRTSSSGGSSWGNWKTGGTLISIDGSPGSEQSRVRQMADGTYQFFYRTASGINLATSMDGINFTTQITDLVKFSAVGIWDFFVLDVQGEDWFYFAYEDAQGDHIAVSRPIYYNFLPIALKSYPFSLLYIGDAISKRPAGYEGEIFYTMTVKAPTFLPSGGHFYLSSAPITPTKAVVDDKIVLLSGGEEVFSYSFSTGGPPQPTIVEIPRSVVEQLAGQTVRVEYRDVYGTWVEASAMWLIWQP